MRRRRTPSIPACPATHLHSCLPCCCCRCCGCQGCWSRRCSGPRCATQCCPRCSRVVGERTGGVRPCARESAWPERYLHALQHACRLEFQPSVTASLPLPTPAHSPHIALLVRSAGLCARWHALNHRHKGAVAANARAAVGGRIREHSCSMASLRRRQHAATHGACCAKAGVALLAVGPRPSGVGLGTGVAEGSQVRSTCHQQPAMGWRVRWSGGWVSELLS